MILRTSGRLLAIAATASLFAVVSARAQVQIDVLGPGETKYALAVSPLTGDGQQGGLFNEILRRDLTLSGYFKVLPRDTYIEGPAALAEDTINFDNWSVIGALGLVKGSLTQEGANIVVEARLFDVNQRRLLSGRRYTGSPSDARRMAHRFADEIMLQFTRERGPFDSRIAFLSTRAGRFKDLYSMSLDGGDVGRITSANTLNISPSWAKGARSILLTSYRDGNPDLFTLSVPGGKWARMSDQPGLNLGGRWSPDGTQLAVAREGEAGNSDIYVLSSNGALRSRLTNHWAIDVSPSWSPDGSRIAFCSSRSGTPQIYVTNVDGTDVQRLTEQGNYNTSPAWAPKGGQIAYASRIGGRFQIFVMKEDGSDVRQITNSAGNNEDPSWSPDGRYLVFSSTRMGRSSIYVSNLSATNQTELTRDNGDDSSPAWSGWLD